MTAWAEAGPSWDQTSICTHRVPPAQPSPALGLDVGEGAALMVGHGEKGSKRVGSCSDFSWDSLTYFGTQLRIAHPFAF